MIQFLEKREFMSLNIENNRLFERETGKAEELTNTDCLGVVFDYVGDPTLLSASGARDWWRIFQEKAALSNESSEQEILSRFVIDLDLPLHLSDLQKVWTAFAIILGNIYDINTWCQKKRSSRAQRRGRFLKTGEPTRRICDE